MNRTVNGRRQELEEGPILDPVFIDHYWRAARRPARWAAHWIGAKMRTLGVASEARVLDVGCGPAWTTRYLAGRFPRRTFFALDLSEPMIRRARTGPDEKPAPCNLRFVVGDGKRLPFGDGRIDAVLSGATIHHLDEPVRFFDEIDRVLAPDGHVLVSDLNRETSRLLWPVILLADRIERRLRPPETRSFNESIANSFRAAYSPHEIRKMLSQSALGRRVNYRRRPFVHWIQTPVRRPAPEAPPPDGEEGGP